MTGSRAVVLESYEAGPMVRELAVGPPAAGGLLVQIEAATVCGTDVHIAHGTFSHLARLPLLMGHEGCGRVVELGAGVTSDATGSPLAPGDLVVWAHNWCGRCYYCAVAKQPTLCENTMGYGWGPYADSLNGTFSEYLHVAPESRVLKVPGAVGAALASSATCALRTIMHALSRLPSVRFSDTVVVLGAGPVGLYAAAAAQAAGAYQTILMGAPASRLAAAEGWGLTDRLDIEATTADERVDRVLDLTMGRGADLVLECAGPPSAFTEALRMVRKGGTTMVIGQAHGQDVPVDTTAVKVRQLTVATSLSAEITHFHDALRFLERHAERLGLEQAVTSTVYGLEEIELALDAMASGSETKPVIDPRRQAGEP